jgi:hypothetical protein
VKMIRNVFAALAFTLLAACGDMSAVTSVQMGMMPPVASSGGSSSPPPPSTTDTADTMTVNLLGICTEAGAGTSAVQYLQACPHGAIAELINTGNSGQVATLWAGGGNGTTFAKELELCLDIAAGDCAGSSIPGAPGDGHLWNHNVLHIISFTATVFEDEHNQYGSISSAGLAVSVPVVLQMTTVAQLPMCDAALKGALIAVSDAASPGYNATLIGGGTTSAPAYCNGSEWTAH